MAGALIDTNVWIAALFPTHPFHHQAREALSRATSADPAVFCRATQQGFLRLACNPVLLRTYGAEGLTNRDALVALGAFLAHAEICERSEPPGLVPLWYRLATRDTASPKVWMDAYLAAFAIAGGLRLVTLDLDFKTYETHGLDCTLMGARPSGTRRSAQP